MSRSLLVPAVLLAALCGAQPVDMAAGGMELDPALLNAQQGWDSCDTSDVDCALSLRQLRASALAPDSDVPPDDELEPGKGSSLMSLTEESLQRKRTVKTGYHLTSPLICSAILKEGFRPGSGGWCGGAIYLAQSYKSVWTKAIGVASHTGCLLKVKVDLGKVKKMPKTCDPTMTAEKLAAMKYDSIAFNPGDGVEFVLFDPARILSIKKVWQDPKLKSNSNDLAPVRVGLSSESVGVTSVSAEAKPAQSKENATSSTIDEESG